MYIESWDEFSQRAKSLYLADPMRARYCIRYNHGGSKLVVKVTDDIKVRQSSFTHLVRGACCLHTCCCQAAWPERQNLLRQGAAPADREADMLIVQRGAWSMQSAACGIAARYCTELHCGQGKDKHDAGASQRVGQLTSFKKKRG
jgi:hypothetical protein